jgi:hypothetical protein
MYRRQGLPTHQGCPIRLAFWTFTRWRGSKRSGGGARQISPGCPPDTPLLLFIENVRFASPCGSARNRGQSAARVVNEPGCSQLFGYLQFFAA